eukprot:1195291-Prorocentrum_minimum.AAC.7
MSLRTRLIVKNTRGIFKVCCTVHEGREGGGRGRMFTVGGVVHAAVVQRGLALVVAGVHGCPRTEKLRADQHVRVHAAVVQRGRT